MKVIVFRKLFDIDYLSKKIQGKLKLKHYANEK